MQVIPVSRLWKRLYYVYLYHISEALKRKKMKKNATRPNKARRWVVEVTHSRMNRFRKLLVRYEKLTVTYKTLLMFSGAFIVFRKAGVNLISSKCAIDGQKTGVFCQEWGAFTGNLRYHKATLYSKSIVCYGFWDRPSSIYTA